MKKAARRAPLGDSIDVANTIAAPPTAKMH